MKGSLKKSLEHAQNMSYLGSSVIGLSWSSAIKELMEHYAQREASYPVLKHIILENLRKIKNEKVDEFNKVLLYDEEIIKEMMDAERRVLKAKRVYEDACERFRQKESGIKRLHQKILSKNELEVEIVINDARNMYILQVNQMNYALRFYIEQFLIDLNKLLVCDLFPQIKQTLDDLAYHEYRCLRDTLQRAIQAAVQDGDEQKRRLFPKTFQNYPLILPADEDEQISIDDRFIPQLSSTYLTAMNDVREADQQIQLALESSVLNAEQNKDSRMDTGKIRLKRMELRKSMALFIMETLENLVPNIKTAPTAGRSSKLISGLKPFMSSMKTETNPINIPNSTVDTSTSGSSLVDVDTTQSYVLATPTYPCQAIVLYDFESANDDEMSVKKDDKIIIQAKPEYDGWLIAKGRDRSGLVPESYVQLIPPPPVAPIELGLMKNSDTGHKKSKSKRKNKKSTNEARIISSSLNTVDDEADYFSDD
jgi:hypothetical protein